MTTLFALDSLLAPIEGEAPGGPDLRADFDSRYHRTLAAREVARRTERELDTATAPDGTPRFGRTDVRQRWAELRESALALLAEDSKDLHVAAWLIEAELRLDGFAGLTRGLELARELVVRYWDDLNPPPEVEPDPDETPLTERLRHLSALNGEGGGGTLIVPLSLVPLVADAEGGDITPYTLEQAVAAERGGSDAALERARRALAEASVDELLALLRAPGLALAALEGLAAAVRERSAPDTPPIGALRGVLEQIERNLRYALGGVPRGATALAAMAAADAPEIGADGSAPFADMPFADMPGAGPNGRADGVDDTVLVPAAPRAGAPAAPPQSRAEAVRQLRHAASWFREHEPHSPVSYVCERAVRWTELTLPELLGELIEDDSARGDLYRLTGIPGGS